MRVQFIFCKLNALKSLSNPLKWEQKHSHAAEMKCGGFLVLEKWTLKEKGCSPETVAVVFVSANMLKTESMLGLCVSCHMYFILLCI